MKKIVITNNKKVESKYSDKVQVKMLDKASSLKVLQEGKEIASQGGRLLQDPTRNIGGYYKSLIFLIDDEKSMPDEKSLSMLDTCINALSKGGNSLTSDKEPIMAGILQNKDLNLVKSIIG